MVDKEYARDFNEYSRIAYEKTLLSRMNKRNAILSMAKVKDIKKVSNKWVGTWEFLGEKGAEGSVDIPYDLVKMINVSHYHSIYLFNVAEEGQGQAFKCNFYGGWSAIGSVSFNWGLTSGISKLVMEGRYSYKCNVNGLSVDDLLKALSNDLATRDFLLSDIAGLSRDMKSRVRKLGP
jgi:hypothetical protein